jgi:type III secretion protein J
MVKYLWILLLLASCAGQQEILSGLNESDANQVIVMLQAKDIAATKLSVPGRTVTYAIKVSASDTKDALKLLVDNKLPKLRSPGLAEVYPIGGGGLIPSSMQEKGQLMLALQGEVENMLLVLPGILQARAVIVLPDPTLIRDANAPPPQSTASVAVVYNPVDSKGSASVTSDDIKYLIASAVPDLSPSGVTVVMASNSPTKFVDDKVASPVTAAATPAPRDENSDYILMLFAGLAAAGLLFGVLGLARSISLRSKLRRLERDASEANA